MPPAHLYGWHESLGVPSPWVARSGSAEAQTSAGLCRSCRLPEAAMRPPPGRATGVPRSHEVSSSDFSQAQIVAVENNPEMLFSLLTSTTEPMSRLSSLPWTHPTYPRPYQDQWPTSSTNTQPELSSFLSMLLAPGRPLRASDGGGAGCSRHYLSVGPAGRPP